MRDDPGHDRGLSPAAMTDAPTEVLVIGGTGFIGGRIVAHLEAASRLTVHPASREHHDLRVAEAAAGIASGVRPGTALVLCAAIRRTVADTPDAMLDNVRMVSNVIEAVRDRELHSVTFLSSVDVYGRPPVSLPVTERTDLRPTSHYGVAKVAGEMLCQLEADRFPVTILRLPGVYGEGDQGRSVIGWLLRNIASSEPVRVSGDGTALRDYVHVDDVATLVHRSIDRARSNVLNVATGRSHRVRDIIALVSAAVGKPARVESIAGETGGDLSFDVARLREHHPGLRLRTIEEGIAQVARRVP